MCNGVTVTENGGHKLTFGFAAGLGYTPGLVSFTCAIFGLTFPVLCSHWVWELSWTGVTEVSITACVCFIDL